MSDVNVPEPPQAMTSLSAAEEEITSLIASIDATIAAQQEYVKKMQAIKRNLERSLQSIMEMRS